MEKAEKHTHASNQILDYTLTVIRLFVHFHHIFNLSMIYWISLNTPISVGRCSFKDPSKS